MRVLELRRQVDLAAESFTAHGRRQLGRQHLDHDLPLEAELLGQEDPAQRSAAELPVDAIAAVQGSPELRRDIGAAARYDGRGGGPDHILRHAVEELVC